MPAVAALLVVFVGIGGPNHDRVDRQVRALVHLDAGAEARDIPAAARHELVERGKRAADIVRRLHVAGLVAGEVLDDDDGGVTLRLVVYRGDGHLTDLMEVPLSGPALSRDDISALRDSLVPGVKALVRAAARDADAAADDDQAPPARPAKRTPVAPPPAVDGGDDADGDADEAAGDALAVSASVGAAPDPLRMGVEVGVGVVGRRFVPGPQAIQGYSSTPVAAPRFAAEVWPSARVGLGLAAERSVMMTTKMSGDAVATTIGHWEMTGSYRLRGGAAAVDAVAGLGRRSFAVEQTGATSPDTAYSYLIAGVRPELTLGRRLTLRATLGFEPVVAGVEPTAMTYGPARRWAIEVAAAVEVRATEHVSVLATADYQRFSWSWTSAGDRGAGGAVDHYPGAGLSLAARY